MPLSSIVTLVACVSGAAGRSWRDDVRAGRLSRPALSGRDHPLRRVAVSCLQLSLRDVELIPAECGITVAHESIRRWRLNFGGDFASKPRRRRPRPGDTWPLDQVFCASAANCLASGVPSISTGWCSTSWCRTAGTPAQPSTSSSGCCMHRDTSRGTSSPMGCAATGLRGGWRCPVCAMSSAGGGTTGRRTRIGRRADGSDRCGGSSRPSRPSASSHRTRSSTVTSARAVT